MSGERGIVTTFEDLGDGLVGTGRFELPACRLGGGRSIHLSYVPALPKILPALESFLTNIFAELDAVEVN